MRFIRMFKGDEQGAPGVTLYEIDADGWVHRQLQIHADGIRFSPEDILLRRPVSVANMAEHPDAEEITLDEFEHAWAEFDHRRPFLTRVPNAWRAWAGRMLSEPPRELCWIPSGAHPGSGWERVPGFVRLYVRGDVASGWATQRELFLDRAIEWDTALSEPEHQPAPVRRIIYSLGLAAPREREGSTTEHELAATDASRPTGPENLG